MVDYVMQDEYEQEFVETIRCTSNTKETSLTKLSDNDENGEPISLSMVKTGSDDAYYQQVTF